LRVAADSVPAPDKVRTWHCNSLKHKIPHKALPQGGIFAVVHFCIGYEEATINGDPTEYNKLRLLTY